jgi:hypothetical protein
LWDQSFQNLVILGDLTEEKDYHSSRLVNRIVEELTAIAQEGIQVHVLKGNHDYAESANPFFFFLAHFPNCHYYSDTRLVEIGNTRWAFFPHSREPVWSDARQLREVGIDFVGCHQVFSGARSESGREMLGLSTRPLEGAGKVWAGDIHVPQQVGPVEYVGSPYPIHFGDEFEPRVILIDGTKYWNLYPPYIQKLVLRITDPEQLDFCTSWKAGDQVKVELTLCRSEFGCWDKYRKKIQRICKSNELVLRGIELKEKKRERLSLIAPINMPRVPMDQFETYVQQMSIDASDAVVGRGLL